uniref:Uncharacterized protein n=1 Tax=Rhizophora mucronata TaxID=61149 RepID=A0A2P2PV08_RHIMU
MYLQCYLRDVTVQERRYLEITICF